MCRLNYQVYYKVIYQVYYNYQFTRFPLLRIVCLAKTTLSCPLPHFTFRRSRPAVPSCPVKQGLRCQPLKLPAFNLPPIKLAAYSQKLC